MVIAAIVVGVVQVLAAGDSWVLWEHSFYEDKGLTYELQWQRSVAFPDQGQCLKEQARRHTESLAKPCQNIFTGKAIPNCRSVTVDGPTGLKYQYKSGPPLTTYTYWSCWPAGVDPRH